MENTHNRGAGRVQPYEIVEEICRWARENGLRTHLDGARLFNAVVATGISAADWAQNFDTVSVCFSKGLGAPVGSALAGPRELIKEARRHRKLFGGGMRQAGIIAAGALYALENNINRLDEDHANAQILAEAVRETEGIDLDPPYVDTNMVIFRIDERLGTAPQFAAALKEAGVAVLAVSAQQIRAVTHLDVNQQQVTEAAQILQRIAEQLAAGGARPVVEEPAY